MNLTYRSRLLSWVIMRTAPVLLCLTFSGCVTQKEFNKFQYEELSRDEKIIELLNQMADNQLVVAKKMTAQEAKSLQTGRRNLMSGHAILGPDDFKILLDNVENDLDGSMRIK